MSTLDRAFDEVAKANLIFNNLFQRSDGSWQCNLRRASWKDALPFGYGATPTEAVLHAIERAQAETPKTTEPEKDFFA